MQVRHRNNRDVECFILTATYTAEGTWLGVGIVVGCMLVGRRWPQIKEPAAGLRPA